MYILSPNDDESGGGSPRDASAGVSSGRLVRFIVVLQRLATLLRPFLPLWSKI